LEERLVVSREVLEEGVDLLDVEAAEHLHGKLLLADVHGRDAHGTLLIQYSSERSSVGRITRSTNWMAMSTTARGRSSPPVLHGGNMWRMGARTGSVAIRRNATMGLRGSGLTHEIRAAAMMTHEYRSSSQPTNSTTANMSASFSPAHATDSSP